MLVWIPISIVALFVIGYFLSARTTADIPILINGLIPSLPGAETKEESGTTVYIVYSDEDPKAPGAEIFRGYADEDGKVQALISASNVGRTVLIRVRHAAYVFEEFQTTIPQHGVIHTMKMQKDGNYGGKIRGKDVGNLNAYYEESLKFANFERERYMRASVRISGHPFARIPVIFWLASYITLILSFAGDYWRFADAFPGKWDSFIHSAYFSAVTITTLGYGETYPETDLIRVAVSLEAVLGIFIVGFALNSLFYGPRR